MAGSGRPGLPTAWVLSIAFLSVILVVLLGAASFHAWQARRIAKRSHRSVGAGEGTDLVRRVFVMRAFHVMRLIFSLYLLYPIPLIN